MRRDRPSRRGAVTLALATSLLLCLALAASASAYTPIRCNGNARYCDRHFNEVVLPAAHNAMSAASLGWQIPNQQVGIPEQLAFGVRGFLFDTYYAHVGADGVVVADAVKTPASQLYLCHVACQLGATPLIDVLRAMDTFLDQHPDNVLAIVNEDYVAPEDFAREFRSSGLIDHVWRGRTGPWPKVRRMIERGKQLVVTAEHDSGDVGWYHEAYQGIMQETNYNWPTASQITDPAQWDASCAPNRGGTTGTLFLMNHWSPPVAPTPAGSAVVNATDTLVGRALACKARRGIMPTIVAVDMFASGGLFEAVRRLNNVAP